MSYRLPTDGGQGGQGGGGGSGVLTPNDIPGLELWLKSSVGIVYGAIASPPPVSGGTLPPAITFSGTPAPSVHLIKIQITLLGILGVAQFSWALNGVVQATGITTVANYVLGTTGVSVQFPAGNYAINQFWETVPTVGEWDDQSGNGYKFIPGVNAAPLYASAPLTTIPFLQFDGATTTLQESTSTFAQAEPYTVLLVIKPAATSSTSIVFSDGTTNLYLEIASGNLEFAWVVDSTTTYNITESGAVIESLGVYSIIVNGANSRIPANSQLPVTQGTGVGMSNGLSIGSIFGADFYSGDMYEFIIFNGPLTSAQLGGLSQYFSQEYGV